MKIAVQGGRQAKKQSLPAKVWIIDPVNQSINLIEKPNIKSLIGEVMGENCECLKLDNHDNVVWVNNSDTNSRYAWYFEGMNFPFNKRRYSKALIISLGPRYWDDLTIKDWLRWYDKNNPYGR